MKIIRFLRLIIKFFLIFVVSISLELLVLLLQLFTAPIGYRKQTGALVGTMWGWLIARIMRIRITIYGKRKKTKEGVFFISNHSSYIDIFILYSLFLTNFVAKAEIRKWPIIGFLAYCGGTIFVNRKKSTDAKKYVNELKTTLRRGSNILIFPEGTSTRGEEILPFFSSLFQAPLETGISIQPVYIHYYKFAGSRIKDNFNLIDKMSWYGDMNLLPHVVELFQSKGVEVRVFIGEIIKTSEFSQDSSGRKALTTTCYNEIVRLKTLADNME